MDAAQIAAMIADREAGTPGPWKVFYTQDGGNVIGIGDSEAGGVTDPQFGLWRSGKERISNASRIARVPDMEATIIAQAAELERLRAALKPFADIGVGTNSDYQPMIRLDRDAILNARAALKGDTK